MTKPGGWHHSAETRARIRANRLEAMRDPEVRAKISEATKLRMASPEVRQRIRDGIRAASRESVELRALRTFWLTVRPSVRRRFLEEIILAACTDSDLGNQSTAYEAGK
jgi:hypothetical protein